MGGIIVALPKYEDAKNICNILKHRGLEVDTVCNTGAEILSAVRLFENSVVICTKRFSDMHYREIKEYLPKYCDMLLLSSRGATDTYLPEVLTLSLPFKPSDLCQTVEMMLSNQRRQLKRIKSQPRKRSEIETAYINEAKLILMDKNNMTEQEAFRYIQKCSMDSGTNMAEMAQMIITVRSMNI